MLLYRLTSLRYFALFYLHVTPRRVVVAVALWFCCCRSFLCMYSVFVRTSPFFDYAVSKVRAFHVFNAIWMYVEILLVTSVRRILEGKQIKCNPTKCSERERGKLNGIMHTQIDIHGKHVESKRKRVMYTNSQPHTNTKWTATATRMSTKREDIYSYSVKCCEMPCRACEKHMSPM